MSATNLAIICNSLPPYRVHFHRRIIHEVPEIQLHTIVTHSDSRWPTQIIEEINTTVVGMDLVTAQSKPTRAMFEWCKGGRIIKLLKQHKIDAVLINGYNDLGLLRTLRWSHHHGLHVMLWSDSNIANDQASGTKRMVKRSLLRRVVGWTDSFLVCGRLGARYWHRYGAPADSIFFTPVEPDYAMIDSVSTVEADAAAKKHGLDRRRKRFIFSGRLAPVKRVDLLIRAFSEVAAERPAWDLAILGGGELADQLKAMVPPDLTKRVIWTGFIQDPREIVALYKCCDVMVLPSDHEPWALVINEAVAAGLKIIATDIVGAAVELVDEGVNGVLVPPGDHRPLRDAMLRLSSSDFTSVAEPEQSAPLRAWRDAADPVRELRRALAS